MGPVGVQEMIVIFLVALVLFGPKKLPELGKTIGKAITEFRRAQSELKSTFETHMRELEKENESIKEITRSYTDELYKDYTSYDSSLFDSSAFSGELSASTTAESATVTPSVPQTSEVGAAQEAPANGTVGQAPANGTVAQPPVNGTVPRTANSEPTHAAADPTAPDSHSTHS